MWRNEAGDEKDVRDFWIGGMERHHIVTESGIYIDISEVPTLSELNEYEAKEFSNILKVLKDKISDDNRLQEVGVHEAGHIIQFALQGINRVNLYGPTIRYRPGNQDSPFFGFPAAVHETVIAKQVMNDVDGVKLLTARCVSGGVATHIVFEREFEDIEDEMSSDHDQFEKMCNDAEAIAAKAGQILTIGRQIVWSGMLTVVTKTYEARKSIQTEILTVAEQVKEAIRSWRGDRPIPIACDLGPT
jgi:hypothetical protein